VGRLNSKEEAAKIYDEVRERYGSVYEEVYNPAMDVAERVFANFLNKDLIEEFRSDSVIIEEFHEIDYPSQQARYSESSINSKEEVSLKSSFSLKDSKSDLMI